MRSLLIALTSILIALQSACAPQSIASTSSALASNAEQDVLALSRQKWLWMAERNVERLTPLFHDQAKFVHMSGTWGKAEEIEIIRSGSIHYKQADVHLAVAEVVDDTAILWNRITLVAAVRGADVTTQFTVTEVYKKLGDDWKLLALTFSSVRDDHTIR